MSAKIVVCGISSNGVFSNPVLSSSVHFQGAVIGVSVTQSINFGLVKHEDVLPSSSIYSETQNVLIRIRNSTPLSAGSMWSTYIDCDGAYNGSDGTFVNGKDFETVIDAVVTASQGSQIFSIFKDNIGNAYLPALGFNGIGNFINGVGYTAAVSDSYAAEHVNEIISLSFTGNPPIIDGDNGNYSYGSFITPIGGPQIIGVPLPPTIDGQSTTLPTWPQIFENQINSAGTVDVPYYGNQGLGGQIEIIKNSDGNVVVPQFGFDGIGSLIPGEAYDVRIIRNNNGISNGTSCTQVLISM